MKSTLSILMFIVGNLACINSTSAQTPNVLLAGCCTSAGKCVGKANCRACSTCEYCRYCNSGGSCGVCAGKNSFSEYPFPPGNSNSGSSNISAYPNSITANPPPSYGTEKEIPPVDNIAILELEFTNNYNSQQSVRGEHTKLFYNSKNGKKVYATFYGWLINGKPQGYGYLQYDNGDWYKGTYSNGERCGTGISFYASSNTKKIRVYPPCQ